MGSSHKINTSHVRCRICGSDFSTAALLKQHVLDIHDKVKPLKCPKCDYKCAFKSELRIHNFHVHQEKTTTAGFEEHLEEHLKRFKCLKCEYRSDNVNHMKEHVSAIHEKVKPFKCPKCDYRCNRKRTLKKHDLRHHQEKRCSICNKEFSEASCLKQHLLEEHDKERPYEC